MGVMVNVGKCPESGFYGHFQIGKVRLGWVIRTRRDAEQKLLREWKYATPHSKYNGVRIPFPVTAAEWTALQKQFQAVGLLPPAEEVQLAVHSIENADFRFALSHAKERPEAHPIPGLTAELFPFQCAGVEYARSMGWRALIGDDMGLGKAQPLDAKILTPDGWTTMGALKVGDFVMGSRGIPTRVTGIYPQGLKDSFQIVLKDSRSTRCCLEHLWTVKNQQGVIKTLSLTNILECPVGDFSIPVLDTEDIHWVSMEKVVAGSRVEMQCISVDAPDRLYVTDDFILTHNTIQGISCALASHAKRVVVVTRAVAVEGWHRSIRRFSPYAVRVATGIAPVALGKKGKIPKVGIGEWPEDYVPLAVKLPKLAEGEVFKFDVEEAMNGAVVGTQGFQQGVLLLNYDLLGGWESVIRDFQPDMIVLDEVHAIKEPTSKRSQVAYRMVEETEKVIMLSGTPIPNRPAEFFHLANILHPGKWGDWYKFAHEYCDAKRVVIGYDWKEIPGKFVQCRACAGKGCKQCNRGMKPMKIREEKTAWDFTGASNEKEMYNRMRGFGMVRRMKDDVLNMMPPMQETILLEPTSRYQKVEEGFLEILDGEFNPLEKKKDEVAMHELFAAAAADKIDWAKSWISDFLEDTEEKLVVFFHHKVVGEAMAAFLKEKGIGFVRAFGADKDPNVEQEFTKPEIRVALCSYGVAREAVTLTESSYMLCMEFAWVPGWMQQAMDRIRRIGQERVCNYYFPVFRNTVEERIVNAFMNKQDVLSVIMQGKILRSVQVDLREKVGP